MKPTAFQVRVLSILRDRARRVRPREMAQALWPDSPGWQRVANCGPNGATRGIWMAGNAARALWRLHARGWAREETYEFNGRIQYDGWVITEKGRQALEQAERGARA